MAKKIEHDWGYANGLDGELDLPVPISKKLAYRLPFSGNIYYHPDNLTITYGHNIAPVDPYTALFAFESTAPTDYVVDNRGQNARSKRHTSKQFQQSSRIFVADLARQRRSHFSPVVKRYLSRIQRPTIRKLQRSITPGILLRKRAVPLYATVIS